MALKACKHCKFIHEEAKCPECGSEDSADTFKGKIIVLKPEESEIAKNLNIEPKRSLRRKLYLLEKDNIIKAIRNKNRIKI